MGPVARALAISSRLVRGHFILIGRSNEFALRIHNKGFARAIALQPEKLSINALITRLRQADPPVVGRVQDNKLLIDPRTLDDNEEESLIKALQQAINA